MPIPDYQSIMLPLLSAMSDGAIYKFTDVRDRIAIQFPMTEEELEQRIPSGQNTYYENRAGWARTYLKKAGLIEGVSRGHYRISNRGQEILRSAPARIDQNTLRRFPEFLKFINPDDIESPSPPEVVNKVTETQTPTEILDSAYQRIRADLADELMQATRAASPTFFEKLVVDLLLAMGYGGSRKDAGRATKRTGDDGIDGVINEDRLGLDKVYIQAKRWSNNVGRPELQGFAGSLDGNRANKGVFITTSDFTKDARDYVQRTQKQIVLIDGRELAKLMIDFGIGVSKVETYQIQKLNQDYFEE